MPNTQTLSRFLKAYFFELRLTVSHWSYLLFIAVWSIFIVSNYANDDLFSTRAMFNFALGLSSLVGLVFTGMQASRAQRTHFDRLETAFPTGAELFFARWFASITSLYGMFLAPVIISFFIPSGKLDGDYVILMLFLSLLVFAFITGLVWIIQYTVGIRRWMYPFLAGFWLIGGLIPGTLRQNEMPVPGANLINFITMDAPMNSLWGTLIQGRTPFFHILFYIGIIMLFAGVMLWSYRVKRFHQRSPFAIALTLIAVGVAGFAALSYTAEVASANQIYTTQTEQQSSLIPAITAPSSLPFAVTEYDLTFRQGDPAQLSAQMKVLNRGTTPLTELTFSLNHQFEVTTTDIPFTQQETTLTFSLPDPLEVGEETSIQINYQGNLWVLEPELGRLLEASNFIHPDGVRLSYSVLWYPVAGIIPMQFSFYGENGVSTDYNLLDQPAIFRLTVEDTGSLNYTSNLSTTDGQTFTSSGALSAELIGIKGDALRTETKDGLQLVTTETTFPYIEPIVDQFFTPLSAYLHGHFAEMPPLKLHVLDLPALTRLSSPPPTAENIFMEISPRNANWLLTYAQNQYNTGAEPIIIGLFGGQRNSLTENIAYFLWSHYMTNGDIDQMRGIIVEGLPSGGSNFYHSVPHEERYQIAMYIYEVYATQGEAAAFNLLNEIRQHTAELNQLPVADILIWMQGRTDE